MPCQMLNSTGKILACILLQKQKYVYLLEFAVLNI
jgi:hypothetical protein